MIIIIVVFLLIISLGYLATKQFVQYKSKLQSDKIAKQQQELEAKAESENMLKSLVSDDLKAIQFEDWKKQYYYACPNNGFKNQVDETAFANHFIKAYSGDFGFSITNVTFDGDELTDETDALIKYTITATDSKDVPGEAHLESSWLFNKGNPGQWCAVFNANDFVSSPSQASSTNPGL